MKKNSVSTVTDAEQDIDDILPEYDFSRAMPNKYASRYQKSGLVVTLDSDIATVFPSASEVNNALRSLAKLVQARVAILSKKKQTKMPNNALNADAQKARAG